MKNNIDILIFLSILVFSCAGTTINQQQDLNFSTEIPYPTYDAGLPEIQLSSYGTTLPSIEETRTMPEFNPDSGEAIFPLRTGQPAPSNGVLFNGPAVARLEVEFRGQASRCLIERRADQERIISAATRDLQLLQSTITTDRTISRIVLDARDRELRRNQETYNELLRRSNPNNILNTVLWVGGGVMAGAGLVSLIYLLTHP